MATKKEKDVQVINIRPLDEHRVDFRVVGDSGLITHCWSEKARKEMRDKQMGTNRTKRKESKSPTKDFANSLYWLSPMPDELSQMTEEDGEVKVSTEKLSEDALKETFEDAVRNGARFGMKAICFKLAGNAAAYRKNMVPNQMALRSAYHILADEDDLVEIHFSEIRMREDPVKLQGMTADLRYRAEFCNWYCDLRMTYDANSGFSLEDLLNVVNIGGYGCGVGEWRLEKDGLFGRYHIVPATINQVY